MSASTRQKHWDGVYETKADDQVSWYQPRPAISLELIAETGLAPNARVLDVGGGASRLVDALLDDGLQHVSVLDISETAIGRAKARLGERAARVDWIVADITAWTPTREFDIWHDRAVFHFLTEPDDRVAYVRALSAAVRRGGQVIVGTFAPDGPERCSGLPIVRYDADGLSRELGGGFRLLATRGEDHTTPAGKVQRFQFARFERV